ncbi:MAG: 16S rRNA processing protein RimM [Clostridia bacterium]|nr:16S rRNA processing protein RimM [Clostridia bacterium]
MPLVPYLEIGRAVGTHGVRGEVRVQPWGDSPAQWLPLRRVFTAADGSGAYKARARTHGNLVLLTLEGVTTMQAAEALRGTVFFAAREDLKLPAGTYFVQDLLGIQVRHADTGEVYGTIRAVSRTGANDVYHLAFRGREVLIPAIPDVVRKVDPQAGVLYILPMAGLFDDED